MDMFNPFMVSTKGQVTIPVVMREKYGFKAGDMVIWEEFEDRLTLKKPVDFFALRGCLGKVKIPEDEEELFIEAIVDHVIKDC